MAEFSMNTQCFDPSETFKFRFKWDGTYVAGIRKVSTLKRTTEVVDRGEHGDPGSGRTLAGRTKCDAITLERNVSHDREFDKWANKVLNYGSVLGAGASLTQKTLPISGPFRPPRRHNSAEIAGDVHRIVRSDEDADGLALPMG